jgi:UDP-3-O-[3-hydroxymyristoyl] glucosamine N-acyltransferase
LAEVAHRLGADLHGNPSIIVSGVADLSRAKRDEIAVLTDPGRLEEARSSAAAALLVQRRWPELERPQLLCPDGREGLGRLLGLFRAPEPPRRGISAQAAVDPLARIDPTAYVGPFVFIGAGAEVGPGCQIEPSSYVGAGARLGRDCRVGPGAVVGRDCELAAEVVLGPGAVVGHDGFGYYQDRAGWQPVPSAGNVALGRAVTVGANSCVDRGTLASTAVGEGTKIDNLVQVGHNVRIGERALLCAQVGLAGSARIDDDAVLAGQAGVADHRRVGAGARVGAGSGVARDVAPGATVSGYPAIAHPLWLRASTLFARLGQMARQLRELARRVDRLTERVERRE